MHRSPNRLARGVQVPFSQSPIGRALCKHRLKKFEAPLTSRYPDVFMGLRVTSCWDRERHLIVVWIAQAEINVSPAHFSQPVDRVAYISTDGFELLDQISEAFFAYRP